MSEYYVGCQKCRGSGKVQQGDHLITCEECCGTGESFVVDTTVKASVKYEVNN